MRNTTNQYKKLFSLSRDAVLGVLDGKVVFSNAAADALFSTSIEGKKAADLLPQHMLTGFEGSLACSAVICNNPVSASITQDGDFLLICISPLRDSDLALFPYSQSVISSLNSSIHSLRTSANWLISNVDMEKEDIKSSASIMMHSYFLILRSLSGMTTLQQLRDDSIPFEPAPIDLNVFLGELIGSVNSLTSKLGMTLDFKPTAQELVSNLDHKLFEQLILNLFSNSLSHMQTGDEITVSLASDGERIIVAIDDNGSGMDQTTLSSLFSSPAGKKNLSEFPAGNGFGLHIAQGIVEKHGGVLLCESREGEGTSVRIKLPPSPPTAPRFNDALGRYETNNMDSILRELSGVLDSSFYEQKYF